MGTDKGTNNANIRDPAGVRQLKEYLIINAKGDMLR